MNAMLEEFYDYLTSEIDEDRVSHEEETGKPFSIENQEQAIWALRKIRAIRARKAEATNTAKEEITRIENWLKSIEEKAEREESFFNGLLRDYMTKLREQDPKLKTLPLPGGKLTFRKQQPEYTYIEDKLLPWVKENLPAALMIKESVSKQTVKDHIKETGEVIPGVFIEERPDRFNVEVE